MEKEIIEQMIRRDFIENNSLICIDEKDIEKLCMDSDFMDGCKMACFAKEMKMHLLVALDGIRKKHAGAKLKRLAIKLLFNKESELMMEDMGGFSDVFNMLDDVEIFWGIGKNENSQNGRISICLVCGFNNA